METLLRDLKYALRTLVRARAFTAVAVLTLALGIGASAAIFSVVHAVLLRALPYPNAEKIVRIWEQKPNGHRLSLADPNFEDFKTQNNTFAEMAEYASLPSSISGAGEPVRANIAAVTDGFFETFGVAPFRGRGFTAEELRAHGDLAIVSYAFWQGHLGAPAGLSQVRLRMEGAVYQVIGVMPPAFDFPAGTTAWIPRTFGRDPVRTGHNWAAVGRVRDQVTVAQARANLSAIALRIKQQYGKDADLNAAAVVPLADALVGDVRTALLTLMGAVGLLLLVACANVAGLLVARASARRRELAVRAALGAGRSRLMRQFLAESFLLSAAAGSLGIFIAAWAVRALPAILPANLPRQGGIAIDPPVLFFAVGAVIAVAAALGLFAAWRAGRGDLQEALVAGSRGPGASHRFRGVLVTLEIAMTMVILTGAGLLGRSFLRLIGTNAGFNARNLITMEFPLPSHNWIPGRDQAALVRQAHLMDEVLTRLRAIPGAESVGLAGAMPVAQGDDLAEGDFLILNGHKPPANLQEFGQMVHNRSRAGHALYCVAGEEYFRTLNIPLLRGRMFAPQDDWSAPHVALISQSLARVRWPNQNPIGESIEFGNMDGNLKPLTIIGIVGDVRARGLDLPPDAVIYVNYRQRGLNANSTPTILMRSAAPAGAIAGAARAIFSDLVPDAPVKFSTFADEMGGWLSDRRLLLLLVGMFAAAALALAAAGIYGIVAFSVTRRTQEIGIRVALGARQGDVMRLILYEGARLVLLGAAIGIAASLAVTRLLASLLFEISATDPATFAGVAALLAAPALAASYIPARRAMRLDPNAALRYE